MDSLSSSDALTVPVVVSVLNSRISAGSITESSVCRELLAELEGVARRAVLSEWELRLRARDVVAVASAEDREFTVALRVMVEDAALALRHAPPVTSVSPLVECYRGVQLVRAVRFASGSEEAELTSGQSASSEADSGVWPELTEMAVWRPGSAVRAASVREEALRPPVPEVRDENVFRYMEASSPWVYSPVSQPVAPVWQHPSVCRGSSVQLSAVSGPVVPAWQYPSVCREASVRSVRPSVSRQTESVLRWLAGRRRR